jgi:hypothetical protein
MDATRNIQVMMYSAKAIARYAFKGMRPLSYTSPIMFSILEHTSLTIFSGFWNRWDSSRFDEYQVNPECSFVSYLILSTHLVSA